MAMVVFCTDYGLADPYVGLCHATLRAHAEDLDVVDLTHGVPPQDVQAGARVLADAIVWLPEAVVLAVVDPGVGTERRAVVLRSAEGRLLVGPDNGLLVEAADAEGGIAEAWVLPVRDPDPAVPLTFDGRDVFAPAAARLATGADPEELGVPLDRTLLVRPRTPSEARVGPGRIATEVRHVDGYGNVQLTARWDAPERAALPHDTWVRVSVGTVQAGARLVRAFATVPRKGIGILPDAFGRLQLAVRDGDAAERMGLAVGDRVVIEHGS